MVITIGAIRRAKLQSKCCHQQTSTQFFYRPLLSPNQQCQSIEGKFTLNHRLVVDVLFKRAKEGDTKKRTYWTWLQHCRRWRRGRNLCVVYSRRWSCWRGWWFEGRRPADFGKWCNNYLQFLLCRLSRAPCGLRGCKNWPAPFPGRMMSYKATKPGLVSVLYLSMRYMVLLFIRAPFYVLLVYIPYHTIPVQKNINACIYIFCSSTPAVTTNKPQMFIFWRSLGD